MGMGLLAHGLLHTFNVEGSSVPGRGIRACIHPCTLPSICVYTHTHTGTLISHTVRAFPGLQASRAQCCSMPVAALVLSSLGSSSRAAWLRSPQPQSLAGMGAAESAGACCTSDPITYLHSLAVTPRHGAVGCASAGPHA